jgi:hypothetical protein
VENVLQEDQKVYSRELRFESLSLSAVEVTRLDWLNGSQQTVDLLVVFGCYKPMITDTILVKSLLAIQSNLKKSRNALRTSVQDLLVNMVASA